MPSPEDPPAQRRRRPIRLSALVAILGLVAAVGGYVYLQAGRTPVKVFVATEASPVSTLGGRLGRGDQVDVLLSPIDADAKPGRLTGVLILDVAKDSVVLGVTAKNATTLLRARGSSSIAMLRVRTYVSPW